MTEPACLGRPEPYDVLMEVTRGHEYNAAVIEARILCGSCPLQASCLRENAFEPWVIAMIAGPKAVRPDDAGTTSAKARCGTDSGYYRHLRGTKEQPKSKPCDACKEAHRDAVRSWNASKREVAA